MYSSPDVMNCRKRTALLFETSRQFVMESFRFRIIRNHGLPEEVTDLLVVQLQLQISPGSVFLYSPGALNNAEVAVPSIFFPTSRLPVALLVDRKVSAFVRALLFSLFL